MQARDDTDLQRVNPIPLFVRIKIEIHLFPIPTEACRALSGLKSFVIEEVFCDADSWTDRTPRNIGIDPSYH
jgi:hypothetical protein